MTAFFRFLRIVGACIIQVLDQRLEEFLELKYMGRRTGYSRSCSASRPFLRHRHRAEIQRSEGVANLDGVNLDAKKPNLLGRKLVQPVDGGPVRRSEMRRNPYNVPRLVFSRICDCLAEMPVIGPFELILYNHLITTFSSSLVSLARMSREN